ncbi:MAG: valine--tRNA ligase [Thermoprotei archaeon]|nr:MAG: valine--tRNA ligase [Thermoprotei archaeon]RLF02521.1 MAG: valine--tRNA ligase [Thermoprotei archaeon]
MRDFKPAIKEKIWDPSKELELMRLWEKEGLHAFDYSDEKSPVFVIDTPPPYPSGRWHIGAVAHYTQIDMIARAYRMLGYNVLVPFYTDRNGLPVEVQVEKTYNINPRDYPREEFLKLCKEFLNKVEAELIEIVKRFGMSFEIWKDGTDSPVYRSITQATFIELYKKGLIYEAERPVNYCPRCKTTLAEAELEIREEDAWLYYIKFRVHETGEEVVIATTRPELLCVCNLVIFNPADERYNHLEGKHAVVPLYNHHVKIIPHPYARMDFGTGLVMMCSFGDKNDVMIHRELQIPFKVAITQDGRMNELAGPYKGLSVVEARRKIVEDLEKQGLIVKKEKIRHEIPVCWRCKTPIEYILMKEYYLKQLDFREEVLEIVDKIKFYPPEHKQLLLDWINSVTTDWPISRERFYGTEIPIWYCKKCGHPHLPKPGRYYVPWRENPFEKCEKCGCKELVGETRVFDTWMDSSITALYVSGYMRNEKLFRRAFPIALRPQGKDIIRTWLYYTLLRVYQLTHKPAFQYVRITGMGLDEKGEAMHKSKGNIIDPMPVVEKYGADAVRFWAAGEVKLGSDYRFSKQRLKAGLAYAIKLWNIARFVSSFPQVELSEVKLRPLDLMILGKLNDLIETVTNAYREMDVYTPIHEVYHYTWSIFADHYIEAVKARAYNRENIFEEAEQKGAWFTLHHTLKSILKLLAPIMPFITDGIWRILYGDGRSIHIERFPKRVPEFDTEYKERLNLFMKFNSCIWNYKKLQKISLKDPLNRRVYAPSELKDFKLDLELMHKIPEIRFEEPPADVSVRKLEEKIFVEE